MTSASTATIVRLKYLVAYNSPEDYLLNIAHIAIWSITESGLGLIAGSLATLRPLLRYIPFLSQSSTSRTPASGRKARPSQQSHKLHPIGNNYKQGSFHHTIIEAGEPDWEASSDSDSQKNIVSGTRKEANGITVMLDVHQQSDAQTHGGNPSRETFDERSLGRKQT